MTLKVAIQRRAEADATIPLPAYETAGAAGMDVRANFPGHRRSGVVLAPGERLLIPSGLTVAVPPGYEIQVRPRSGLAFKHGLTVANAPGTIDSDYRGEVAVLLVNLGIEPVTIQHGERIAQFVLAPVSRCDWVESSLDQTARGAGGFGSTGGV